jgi:hypothetical protein
MYKKNLQAYSMSTNTECKRTQADHKQTRWESLHSYGPTPMSTSYRQILPWGKSCLRLDFKKMVCIISSLQYFWLHFFKSSGWYLPVGTRICSSLRPLDRLLGLRVVLSPQVKRQGREADHSPPTSEEDKKMWIYTSTPTYALIS